MTHIRRTVLRAGIGVGIIGSIAGCSTEENGANTATETPEYQHELTGGYTLPAGQFREIPFDIETPAVIDYTVDVRSGPNIDVLVLSREEFREYERGNAFETIASASALDTSYGEIRTDLDPTGSINIVFDNTDAGTATPPKSKGTAELEFEIRVTSRNP